MLAKHSKSFSLIDCISIGVDRVQRSFKPAKAAGCTAKVVICSICHGVGLRSIVD